MKELEKRAAHFCVLSVVHAFRNVLSRLIIPEELKKVDEVISKQKITVKEIFQLMIYAVKNWRLVLSRVMRRGSS